MLKAAGFVFYSEIILLFRKSHEWAYPLGFFIITLSLFSISFTTDQVTLQKLMPGFVWIDALLASLLAIGNVFLTDFEDGHIDQQLLSELPLSLMILQKLLAQWLVTQVPIIIVIPFINLFFQMPIASIGMICLSLFIGTPILICMGALCVSLALGVKQQNILLGLLLLPLLTPVLIFGVNIVQQFQAGFSIVGPLTFLAGLSLFAITLIPWVIGVTLRISRDD